MDWTDMDRILDYQKPIQTKGQRKYWGSYTWAVLLMMENVLKSLHEYAPLKSYAIDRN